MRLIYWLMMCNFVTSVNSFAQTFIGAGGAIPDNGNSIDFSVNVSGLPTSIDTIGFGLESVCINVLHPYNSDLDISLVAPDGTTVLLISGVGGSSNNFLGTCFNQSATTAIFQGTAPFAGNFRPMGQMGYANNGQDPNGDWTLHILDTYPFADAGTLLSWSITFGNDPATVFSLESSNLPVVLINTNGQTITPSPKITAWMGIIDNGQGIRNYVTDPPNDYNGYIGIDLRGHSSLNFPQKQYNIETRDSLGNNLNVSILGMPAENDWVLYAPYNDKSLMRNALTYSLARDMGRYASRAKFCELVLNGEYRGVYTFFEKIKKDVNRVDIAGLAPGDTSGADLTGGYICSIDWIDNDGWTSNYPPDQTNPMNNTVFIQYIYPKDNEIMLQQQTYIQQFVDSFETALASVNFDNPVTGWRKYADESSFIDYFIMNEISKNVDGYRLSTFFYKEKITDGNKIKMGPLWDFNLAWHNANYCNNQYNGGWAYQFTDHCSWDMPFWWRRLDEDTLYQNNVRCRWDDLRTNILDTTYIFNYIDSIALLLDESQQRHYYIYPVLGTYLWPNPNPLAQTYEEELLNMKNWIRQRVTYMDAFLPGNCLSTSLNETAQSDDPVVYPNPAEEVVHIRLKENGGTVQLYDATGRLVMSQFCEGKTMQLNISHLEKGVYMIFVSDQGNLSKGAKLIKW